MTQSRRNFFSATAKSVIGSYITVVGAPLSGLAKNRNRAGRAKPIPTLTGSVQSDGMGTTLMHEHLLFNNIPEEKRQASVDFAIKLLQDAARVGVETVVDLSPTRDIKLYQAIAEKVPLNIIVSTGSYLRSHMPDWLANMNEAQFKDHMRNELTQGIDGTKIRAGIIKVAASKTPMTDFEKMIFRAAAQVQKELNVPIATHAIFEPRDQFDLLVQHGADPKRLFFSHIEAEFGWGGRTLQQMAAYLLAIAKGGGRLLFNNFGFDFDTPWADLVFLIRHLCDNGYADKVLISVDCYWEWKKGKIVFGAEEAHPETRNKTYAYMMTDAVPALLKAGFSAKEIQTFLVKNPAKYFSGS